jgi:hypothetical protein
MQPRSSRDIIPGTLMIYYNVQFIGNQWFMLSPSIKSVKTVGNLRQHRRRCMGTELFFLRIHGDRADGERGGMRIMQKTCVVVRPDLSLCDLVRRSGAHIRRGPIILYTLLYIFLYMSKTNCKAWPSTYRAGCVADSTPRGSRSRSHS